MDDDARTDARRFLEELEGRPLETLTGRPNRILRVEGDSVIVGTNRSPSGKPVPIAWVQDALDRLTNEGEVVISVESVGYSSAFIAQVLSAVPGATASKGKVRLLGR